jgi:hypothetical protein
VAAYAAPPSLDSPPTSPDVSEQQSPTAQFVNGQQGQPGQEGSSASALLVQNLNQVASMLKQVAQILQTTKPNLMPILQNMLRAGSMLMAQIQQDKQQGGQPGVQRQQPEAPPEGGSPPIG